MKTLAATAAIAALALTPALPAAAHPCGSSWVATEIDTLDSIAQRCGSTADVVAAMNPHLLDPLIEPGQRLVTPLPGMRVPLRTADGWVSVYTVRPGDDLGFIASSHGTTVDHVHELNPTLFGAGVLRAGWKLRVPAPAAPSTDPLPDVVVVRSALELGQVRIVASGLTPGEPILVGIEYGRGKRLTEMRVADSLGRTEIGLPLPSDLVHGEQVTAFVTTPNGRAVSGFRYLER